VNEDPLEKESKPILLSNTAQVTADVRKLLMKVCPPEKDMAMRQLTLLLITAKGTDESQRFLPLFEPF